jgi:hypothetical protein
MTDRNSMIVKIKKVLLKSNPNKKLLAFDGESQNVNFKIEEPKILNILILKTYTEAECKKIEQPTHVHNMLCKIFKNKYDNYPVAVSNIESDLGINIHIKENPHFILFDVL